MPGGQHRRITGAAIVAAVLSGAAEPAAAQTYRDSFAEGATALRWEPYSLYGDGVVEGRAVEGASDA